MDVTRLLIVSAAIRLALIAWGVYQDTYMAVKFTDIDYNVFTDAARFVANGGSPFERSTYRYSPLLAYLMLPNIWLHEACGKLMFAAGDIAAGWMIYRMAQAQGASARVSTWAVVAWLYNPFTATISTRGSCDVLVVVVLLAVLQGLLEGRVLGPALLYGLAVQFRIYPIVYAPAIVFFLAHRAAALKGSPNASFLRLLPQILRQSVVFGSVSGSVFVGLNVLFYRMYGQLFLHEAFLHHLTRKDPRHNFSVYFYHIYLTFVQPAASGVDSAAGAVAGGLDPGRLAFLPQFAAVLAFGWVFHRHLPFAWLLQTMAFVAFNKVSTAQYFVWYFSLLPLVLQHLRWPLPRGLAAAAAAWLVAELHWLGWGFLLEFKGVSAFLGLWAASAAFLVANALLMAKLIAAFQPATSFLAASLPGGEAASKKRK